MKTKSTIMAFLAIFLIAWIPGAFAGSGNVIKQTRTVSSFTGIQVGGAFEVYIEQTGTPSVVVEADERIIDYISTEVSGNVLRINMKKHPDPFFHDIGEMIIHVTVADLESLDLSGAVELTMKNQVKGNTMYIESSGAVETSLNLDLQSLEMELSGACEVDITGKAGKVDIQASGASELDADEFEVGTISLFASGACDASVFATGTLKVNASGACSVVYKGSASVDVYTSGASSVRKGN